MIANLVTAVVGTILGNNNKRKDAQKKISKAEQIRRLLREGKSISEVAQITDSHYSTVHTINKKVQKEALTPEPKLFSTEQRVRCLYDTGLSAKQIAKKVKLEENEVEAMICKYQLR